MNNLFASFDIGKKNFAQYIEEIDLEKVKNLEIRYLKLDNSKKRRVKGPMNEDIDILLKDMFLTGKMIQTGVYDFRDDKETNTLDMKVRENFIKHMNSFKHLWDKCSYFIIEQQYFANFSQRGIKGKRTEANVDAIKLSEILITWLMIHYSEAKIILFNSSFKTQILGSEALKEKERKTWAVNKAYEIYKLREDINMIKIYELKEELKRKRLNEKRILDYISPFIEMNDEYILDLATKVTRYKQKLCDISDALLQLQAYKYKYLICKF